MRRRDSRMSVDAAGLFAIAGLIFVMRILPETKGKSLEELEAELVHAE